MSMTKKAIVESYEKIPTGNICDAMDQLGLPLGVISGLEPISVNQKRAVGFAVTIKQMERHQAAEGKSLATHSKVIDEKISYGDMLIVDVNGRKDVCSGGEILAQLAKIKGASGFVVNGCLRDKQGIVDLEFPVHLVGTSPVKSSPHLQTVGVNIPVEINGVQIIPGDLIVADDTGIVVVPQDFVENVLKKALEIYERETKFIDLISGGMSFADAFAKIKL